MLDENSIPLPEYEGFTRNEIYIILYNPFGEECPIKLNKLPDNILLNDIPAFKIVLDILFILKDHNIILTNTGNLPLAIIKEIYSKRILPDEQIETGITKLRTENDWILIKSIKITLLLSKLVTKKITF